jgi:hypothetical protein
LVCLLFSRPNCDAALNSCKLICRRYEPFRFRETSEDTRTPPTRCNGSRGRQFFMRRVGCGMTRRIMQSATQYTAVVHTML